MKRLIVLLFVNIVGVVLFYIGSRTFPTQKTEFFILSLSLICLYGFYGMWMVTTEAEGFAPLRKWRKKRAEKKARAGEEPEQTVEEKELTAMALAKRNWEKILAYCEEHHYHLLSDRKYSLNMPSYMQGNLYELLREREKEEIQKEYIWEYFVIHEHKIMMKIEYTTESHRKCKFLVDMTEDSELTALLCSHVIDCWGSIQSWLKEPEKLLQKCLTFSPEE